MSSNLAASVIAKDAGMIEQAIRERGLQVAGFDHVAGLVHQLRFLHVAVLPSGYYDPVRILPATDKPVLEVDTLVIGNGCASKSASIALLTLLKDEFPDLVAHNASISNRAGLPVSPVAKTFFEKGGPDVVDEYVPWLADLIPVSNLGVLLMAVSLLFNAMGAGNRFRLWRIDANRVRLEHELPEIFGPEVTVAEIEKLEARTDDHAPQKIQRLDALIAELVRLLRTCRKHSLSMLVPMGQEMGYRYQETLITEHIAALRAFRSKLA